MEKNMDNDIKQLGLHRGLHCLSKANYLRFSGLDPLVNRGV